MRSPSQCPGTARSSASAGRSLIRTWSVTKLFPRLARAPVPQRPTGSQVCGQLAPQRATALHIQRLVDRLVRDAHRHIIREVQAQPIGICSGLQDLAHRRSLRGPYACRSIDPPDRRQRTRQAAAQHRTGGVHIVAQLRVGGKLCGLRSPATPVGVPLRGRCPIRQRAAASPGVAAQLPRDRRRRSPDPPGDLAHPQLLGAQQSDLLPLSERQVTPRQQGNSDNGIPPPSRNHRTPTASDTPASTAASTVETPRLIAVQNRTRCSRRPAGGRPGDAPPAAQSDSLPTPSACPSQPPRDRVFATTA